MRWWRPAGAACVGALALSFLLMVPAPSRAGTPTWLRACTAHFTLYSSADSTAVLGTAHELERMAEVIGLWGLGLQPGARGQVVLIGLPDRKSFQFHQQVVDGKRRESAGAAGCLPVGCWIGYREDHPRGRQVARHEYAHALIAKRYRAVPLCLNEGLAEYLSTFVSTEGSCRLGEDIPENRWMLERNSPLPLDELFAVTRDSILLTRWDERTHLFYGESWALVHYFMRQSVGGATRLRNLLEMLADGEAPRAAFAATYPQEDWLSLPQRLQAYMAASIPSGQSIVFVRPLAELAIDLQAVDAAEVTVHLGLWRALEPTMPSEDTIALLQQAQVQPALAPLAIAGLGLVALAQGDLDEALLQFRSAAAKSTESLALSIAGAGVFLVASRRLGSAQDALVLEAKRILSRSGALDGTDAKVLQGHEETTTFLRERGGADQADNKQQDATAERRAIALYNAGIVALRRSDYARALEAFAQASESAPDSSLRAEAMARMGDIADYEAFDRGLAAATANDLLESLRIFERLAAEAANPELRGRAAANAQDLLTTLMDSSSDR